MLKWLRRSRPGSGTPKELDATGRAATTPVAPATTPTTPDADELMRQAFPLHQAGNVAAAEALYRSILTLSPDYADAHYLLGRIAQDRQQYDEAIQHVRRAIRSNSRERAFQR